MPVISVERADVLEFPSDVLVLKYAQGFHGADLLVADRLKASSSHSDIAPLVGQYVLLSSGEQLASESVLFLGVADLYDFSYPEIRDFALKSMSILADKLPKVLYVSMTMHGVGYGLDEREAFLAHVGGLVEAFNGRNFPDHLQRVTIVERDLKRSARLQQMLAKYVPAKYRRPEGHSFEVIRPRAPSSKSVMEAGVTTKRHVFVAMPFGEDMEDVYIFGIQGPANAAGYLCERVDMSVFTGDILGRIKSRIETAALVIADVTGANANVYLEVGYAWGKDRPTLLVARKGEDLKFDVQSQRCIIYKNIADLAKNLEKDLTALGRPSP